jgi:integrase
MRFTKRSIADLALPAGKSELIEFDDDLPGFGLRIRAGGSRTFIVQYRLGKQTRMTLGSTTVLGLDQARHKAREVLARVRLGNDPQAEKLQARQDNAATFSTFIEPYLSRKEKELKRRSFVEIARQLRRDWQPLHGIPLRKLARVDVAGQLTQLAESNGPVASDRARAALSAFFTWAMKEGLVDVNPVIATNRPAEPKARDRVLTDTELREVWNACRDDDHGRIVRLLILTGQRREEVSAMAWSEIDIGKALWSLPAERTKNGRPHDVPLSDESLSLIDKISRREDRDLLFGEGEGPFSGWSKAKAALDGRVLEARREAARNAGDDLQKVKPIPAWRIHDLRRTAATRMADIGILPHVIEAVLNHVSGARAGVAGTYNRSLYAKEKREALTRWANHVSAVIEEKPHRVVKLHAG